MTGAAGTAGIAGLAGCTGGGDDGDAEYPELGNYPIEGDTATFGFNVPQTGSYQEEGEDELAAYELAVDHLNNGGGWVDEWDDLSGDGVLDYEIDYVTGDTQTDADAARESASRMIERDDVIMFSGGSSSATAIAQQGLGQDEKVLYMCCLTHSNDTTGKDCVRYGFREVFNAYQTGKALAPVLADEYGTDRSAYHLYADYTWGETTRDSMIQFTEEEGWETVDTVATPLGESDFEAYLSEAQSSDADTLILNHYGLDASNSVSQAIERGIDEEMDIVVPFWSRLAADGAGEAAEGILGTTTWDPSIDNDPSNTFTDVFEEKTGRLPSGPAYLAYAQTLQYAAAVERAETFYPPEVIRELEGHEYNIGLGETELRECDHQAMHDVPVVQGASADQINAGEPFEVVDITPVEECGYGCDEGPAAECELGEYGDEDE